MNQSSPAGSLPLRPAAAPPSHRWLAATLAPLLAVAAVPTTASGQASANGQPVIETPNGNQKYTY